MDKKKPKPISNEVELTLIEKVDRLEKLLQIKKQKELTFREALAAIKQLQLHMPRTKKAHRYLYAPLEVILPIILPVLNDFGIDFQHTTDFNEKGEMFLETRVFFIDESRKGEYICRTIINPTANLATMNEFMVIGAGTTYFRRYHLTVMFGLSGEPDTDAGGAEDDDGNVKGTNIPTAGRVDDTPKETDFIATFKHQLSLGRKEEQINATFNLYKKKMGDKQIEEITKLIRNHYEKK